MTRLKEFLKPLIPPIVFWALGRVVKENGRVSGETFIGKFDNVDDLKSQLNRDTHYYWPGALEQEFNEQKQRIIEWGSGFPPSGTFRTNFLPAVLTLFPGEEITVLDIGGGLNNTFEYLKFSLTGKKIRVTVIDQSPLIQKARKLYNEKADLSFEDRMPVEKNRFNVVYFGSSIQYFPDYREVIRSVMSLNPQLVVIADSTFGIAKTFVCAQVNMPDTTIPYTVINKKEIEELVLNYGYGLVHQSTNDNRSYNFNAYEYPLNLGRSWNLVFKRIR
jgi:putative methyltransferase (TIGR04325 family)